jgi:hypothetical protein
MTETNGPAKGRDAVTQRVKSIIDRVDRFDVLDTFARGPKVVNERIDRFSNSGLKSWHGVGVFFIKDGNVEAARGEPLVQHRFRRGRSCCSRVKGARSTPEPLGGFARKTSCTPPTCS